MSSVSRNPICTYAVCSSLYYILIYCIVLYCIVSYYNAVHYILLQYVILYFLHYWYIMLILFCYVMLYCTIFCYIISYYSTVHYILLCNLTLHYIAIYYIIYLYCMILYHKLYHNNQCHTTSFEIYLQHAIYNSRYTKETYDISLAPIILLESLIRLYIMRMPSFKHFHSSLDPSTRLHRWWVGKLLISNATKPSVTLRMVFPPQTHGARCGAERSFFTPWFSDVQWFSLEIMNESPCYCWWFRNFARKPLFGWCIKPL